MARRYRTILPLVFGVLSLVLIAWDYYNMQVIESMGMVWDMGPPLWPYQTSYDLLVITNLPAIIAANLVARALGISGRPEQYYVFFLAIFLWWRWFGARLDGGVDGLRESWPPKLAGAILAAIALALATLAISGLHQLSQWWDNYGSLDVNQIIIGSRSLLLSLWPLGIAALSAYASCRLVFSEPTKPQPHPTSSDVPPADPPGLPTATVCRACQPQEPNSDMH